MSGFHHTDLVFFYDREEIENYAAALEALTQSLYHPSIRSGEKYLESTLRVMANLEGFARELIHEADQQEQEEPLPGQMTLDRDALRFLCYGILHAFKTIKDGQKESNRSGG